MLRHGTSGAEPRVRRHALRGDVLRRRAKPRRLRATAHHHAVEQARRWRRRPGRRSRRRLLPTPGPTTAAPTTAAPSPQPFPRADALADHGGAYVPPDAGRARRTSPTTAAPSPVPTMVPSPLPSPLPTPIQTVVQVASGVRLLGCRNGGIVQRGRQLQEVLRQGHPSDVPAPDRRDRY